MEIFEYIFAIIAIPAIALFKLATTDRDLLAAVFFLFGLLVGYRETDIWWERCRIQMRKRWTRKA